MPILTYQERLASADISPRCEDSMYKSFPTSILEDFESSPISQSPSSSGCSSASITSSSEEDADQSSNSDLDDNASAKSGQSGQFISDSSPVTADGDAPSLSSMAGSTNSNVPSAQTIRRSKFNTEYNTRGDPIVWRNVVIFTLLHIFAFRGSYILFTQRLWGALIFNWMYAIVGGMGITAGAHRLWSHKAYKARLPLRIFLMLCNCIAGQNDLHEWVRDHRVHHKFTETDADPHNSHRGFFFAHIGWLMTRKHPDVIRKGKQIDMSDILADPVIRFQMRYYLYLYISLCFLFPTLVTCYWFNVPFWEALMIGGFYRYCMSLHCTWFVNSAAHMFGDQPYNPHISPRENPFVSYGAFGEGFHNYHHSFPWDYKTSEMGWKLNISSMFIDLMALFGLAYNLREMKPHMIQQRKSKVALNTLKKTSEHFAYA